MNKQKSTDFINDLKEYYQFFSAQWNEWLEYKGEFYLTQEELYALSVYIKNDFKICINELVMFYYKVELMAQISLKLKLSKEEFKEWARISYCY
jgi:hypothetical protein